MPMTLLISGVWLMGSGASATLSETNIAPKNGWLEYYFPIGEAYFLVQNVSFREGRSQNFARNILQDTDQLFQVCGTVIGLAVSWM